MSYSGGLGSSVAMARAKGGLAMTDDQEVDASRCKASWKSPGEWYSKPRPEHLSASMACMCVFVCTRLAGWPVMMVCVWQGGLATIR